MIKVDDLRKVLLDHSYLLENRGVFKSGLEDLFPQEKLSIVLLHNAYCAGVYQKLIKVNIVDKLLVDKMVAQICDDYGVSRENALWSVETWCEVLGKKMENSFAYTSSETVTYKEEVNKRYQENVVPCQEKYYVKMVGGIYRLLNPGIDDYQIEVVPLNNFKGIFINEERKAHDYRIVDNILVTQDLFGKERCFTIFKKYLFEAKLLLDTIIPEGNFFEASIHGGRCNFKLDGSVEALLYHGDIDDFIPVSGFYRRKEEILEVCYDDGNRGVYLIYEGRPIVTAYCCESKVI